MYIIYNFTKERTREEEIIVLFTVLVRRKNYLRSISPQKREKNCI
jgi:hypothetical protein